MSEQSQATPSSLLSQEHRVIERVLRVLDHLVETSEAGGSFETVSLKQCVEFFRLFADACHHAKEEDLFFPALELRGVPREGGPIGVMLYEHNVARRLTRRMGEALEAFESGDSQAQSAFEETAREYLDLLHQHIFKEDNILFAMGERVIPPEEGRRLCEKFGQAGCRAFGGKTLQELESLADDLESRWLS